MPGPAGQHTLILQQERATKKVTGLDIFQYVAGDVFGLATKLQDYRQVKAFGVTYIRESE